jgi:hypothetical protein
VSARRHGLRTPGSTLATAGGAPVLRGTDTFVIAGCPFLLRGGVPSPCISATWVVTAMQTKFGCELVLNDASVGLCLAATQAPQGTVLIAYTQCEVSGE